MSLIRVGNAPVSWGVYEADRPNPPFGRILDEIARAGYEGTELGPYGYLPTEAGALERELKARRLGLGSSFVALPLEDASRPAASVAHVPRVARLLAPPGGGAGVLVGLLLDTGHCVYGGGEPLDVLKRHRGRVRYLHLKDARERELRHVRTSDVSMAEAWKRGVFCPLGEGVVDFPRVIETLRGDGYAGSLIVEQDVVADEQGRLEPDPSDSARKSRAYLRD